MANMRPFPSEEHSELEELFRLYDETMGFVPEQSVHDGTARSAS